MDDCILWHGFIDKDGYGRIGGRLAHRIVYEECLGFIPDGRVIDHLCKTRRCINPNHMEPVTIRENTRRGSSPSAKNARKTHCNQGHLLDEVNTYVLTKKARDGTPLATRHCRACNRAHKARYASRLKEAHDA